MGKYGNSLIFGEARGFKFSFNLDYLFGNWKEMEVGNISYDIEDDLGLDTEVSKLSIGLGVRYNF